MLNGVIKEIILIGCSALAIKSMRKETKVNSANIEPAVVFFFSSVFFCFLCNSNFSEAEDKLTAAQIFHEIL